MAFEQSCLSQRPSNTYLILGKGDLKTRNLCEISIPERGPIEIFTN